jgi:ElaB/YqjD/DUF883 family membrane-anchored ribosome-binding protein
MNAQVLTPAKANLKLTLLNAEAESVSSNELYLWLIEQGLSSEAAIRLKNLVDVTQTVGERIINIGKIILMQIVEFVKKHPHLVMGIAIGAAIGILIGAVPFLGVYLAPIAAVVPMAVGAIAGHRLDKMEQGKTVNTSDDFTVIAQDIIEIAKEFFTLLIDIFNTVFDEQLFVQA